MTAPQAMPRAAGRPPASGKHGIRALVIVAGLHTLLPSAARCDEPEAAQTSGEVDKSGYSLFDPTPDDVLRAFAPDRPGKSQSPYTVDAGQFQIESDFLTYTYASMSGVTTRSYTIGAPLLKAGITNWADLEVAFALYNETRTSENGRSSVARGFGDIQIGSKINLLGNDGGDQALALLPFIKLPTAAANLGNGVVEYTINIPYSHTLPDDWSLTLEPIVSVLKNAQNSGYHTDLAGVVTATHSVIFDALTGGLEFFAQTSGDRHNRDYYTFDPSLAWLVTPNLQLDAGIYIGLNSAAPAYDVYSGISYRF
jgi:hypothetical protein